MENKKKLILILAIVAGMLLTGFLSYLNAKYINPSDYKVRNITVSDSHLPDSFDGFTVMFISDLEYGTYFTKDRLDRFINKIDNCEADVVIFGGDLFDKDYNPVSNDITALRSALKSIDAPKGKFAILGDFDYVTEQRSALVRKLLFDAEFEMLQDNNIKLHNATSETMNLVGFNYTEGALDVTQSFTDITNDSYTITVVHGALFAESLPSQLSDLTLSGHSHHSQLNLPFVINYNLYPNTGTYGPGKYNLKNNLLYVSNGVGTTTDDIRIFSDPEVLFITFRKK